MGYAAGDMILEIEFRSGATYRYSGVPSHVYERLMAAESKGRFINANIRDRYPYVRVA